jgi:hypothetical protein
MNDLNYSEQVARIVLKLKDQDAFSWETLALQFPGLAREPLFTSLPADKITALVKQAVQSDPGYQAPDFSMYFALTCAEGTDIQYALESLQQMPGVELAYADSGFTSPPALLALDPLCSQQEYLDPAPSGIDARYAWTAPGGDGAGKVKFIDIEQGWITEHEDVPLQWLPLSGLNHTAFADHGAATMGVIIMQDNDVGGIGIAPGAQGYVISQWRPGGIFNTADAIMASLHYLQPGDILLLEIQTYAHQGGLQLLPVEVLEPCFQAIRLATALGITVIEAAGNGNQGEGIDLDQYADASGNQILNRHHAAFRDSGAILVAAATSTLPHIRIACSNYGSRIDCYAWGEHVVTAGSYPRSSGAAINTYTLHFSGTSSASAIIAGAAVLLQNIHESVYSSRIGPGRMRSILSDEVFGTVPAGSVMDKIGVMPDLRKIITYGLQLLPGVNNFIPTASNNGTVKKVSPDA